MKRLLTLLVVLATLAGGGAAWADDDDEEGRKDGRNFNAILRPAAGGPEDGFGKVEFRQPRDENKIVYLTVRLQELGPNNAYYLERATDMQVNDDCTAATNWLRLGAGLVSSAIATDNRGRNGRALLFRDLAAVPEGTRLDIHFRVVDAITNAVVLVSDCNQFTVRQ